MAQPAFDHLREARDESESASRRLVASARDAVSRTGATVRRSGATVRRAGAPVQTGMGAIAERAQDLAHGANDRIEQLTGRPIQAWPGDARRLVRDHPFQVIAATVGLGYVVGKILRRRG